MKIPPIKYWFNFKRWKWFIVSKIKKYLESIGELSTPLTKSEQFEIARRVANSQECFFNDHCLKCKCNIVDAINTKTYHCKHGCFPPAIQSDEELEEYLSVYNYAFGKSKITTKND
jgi:hypothetical protein